MHPLGVVLLEDHDQMLSRLLRLLADESDFRVLAEARDGSTGMQLALELHPDDLVTDLVLPGVPGLQVILRVHREHPEK